MQFLSLKMNKKAIFDIHMARIKKQMPQEEYEALANKVIYNNGSIEDLENSIKEIKPQLVNYKKFMM